MTMQREMAELKELFAKTQKLLSETLLNQQKAAELAAPGTQYRVASPLR